MNISKIINTTFIKYRASYLRHLKKNKDVVKEASKLIEKYNIDFKFAIYILGHNVGPICKYNRTMKFLGFNDPLKFCGNRKDCQCNSESTTKKMKATCMERYGVESNLQTNACKDKIKSTNNERYGCDYPAQSKNIQKKKALTCFIRYNVESYSKTKEFKDKLKKTNLRKYGVTHHNQRHIPKNVLNKLNDKDWLIEQHYVEEKTQTHISNDLNVDISTITNYFQKHNIEIKYYSYSFPEKLLAQYIEETYNTNVIRNNRTIVKPKELDIYLPEYNLAIEYNGRYWHNPNRYGSKLQWFLYHQNKEELCKAKGIQLLHLWEGYENHNDLVDKALSGIIDNNLIIVHKSLYSSKP